MPGPNFCTQCGAVLPEDGKKRRYCPGCLLRAGLEQDHSGAVATALLQSSQPAPAPDELAPHFPKLRIEQTLGRGGMGWVYRAHQIDLDRPVALKILPGALTEDESFRKRFAREAKALAQLSHPHIVAVHDTGEAGGYVYFVMEFVEGTNLREIMRDEPLAPPDAMALVGQICEALEYAHGKGVVHRDIKPENVLVDTSGKVKIADFGLARLIGEPGEGPLLTGSHQVLGTPHYMAPEQWENPRSVDHRADIYALGVIFYEMLTGELPLGRFDAPSQVARTDERLDEVVLKTLQKEPDRRYQRISQVHRDLEDIREGKAKAKSGKAKRGLLAGIAEELDLDELTGGILGATLGTERNNKGVQVVLGAGDGNGLPVFLAILAAIALLLPLIMGLTPILLFICAVVGVVIPGALALRHMGTSRAMVYSAILAAFVASSFLAVFLISDLAWELDHCLYRDPATSVQNYEPNSQEYFGIRRMRETCGIMFVVTAVVSVALTIIYKLLSRKKPETK